MARPLKAFHLRPEDKLTLEQLLWGGVQQVRVVLRALSLLGLDAGMSSPALSAAIHFEAASIRVMHNAIEIMAWIAHCMNGPKKGRLNY